MQCQEFTSSAPGDEYFGRMKISYLGIDNTFKDGTISAGAYTTDSRLISKLMFADEALQRWASKYPGDPQLPRAYFLGVQVFRKVYTQDGQQIAWRYMQTLVKTYPNTYFGKTIKESLSKGFTEHWFANALPCPTPLPKGVQPERTPSASPTPSPAPGQPSVEIIVPPCVPATPSPSPAPTGSAIPAAPQPTGSASPGAQPSGSPRAASPLPSGAPQPSGSPRLASPAPSALPPVPSGAVAPVPSASPSTRPSPPAT
jgi:hypothetical protein